MAIAWFGAKLTDKCVGCFVINGAKREHINCRIFLESVDKFYQSIIWYG